MKRSWSPRCCLSCGEPLEEWKHPLELGAFVPCLPCGRLFVVVDGGVESVVLSLEAPELRDAFAGLLESWFALERRRDLLQPNLNVAA